VKRAAVYCRISQDREGAGLGVERQRSDCEALAAKLRWPIVAVHTDNDASAYTGKARPGYRALLDDIETGRANAVLVWHTDRLHRSPRELEHYVDLCETHKVVTQTVKAGELDLATPSGRAVARTLGAWSRFEVEHKSERTRRAQLQAAQAGKWLGGARPFGWQMHSDGSVTVDRREAREIRNAAKVILAGSSLGSVVADLNARGVTTSTGGRWNYTSLRQVLSRARNAGLSEFKGEVVGQSTFPPLLTEDTWRAVVGLLADPSRRRSQSNRVRWLLAGLAECVCGERVRSATAGGPHARPLRTVYRCRARGPGHIARSAEPVDELVAKVVIERLSRPDARDLLTADDRPDMEALRVEAMALRTRLGEAADSFSAGDITRSQLELITSRVQSALGDVEARMAAGSRRSVLAPIVGADVRAAWERLSIEQRRAVVDALMVVRLLPVDRGTKRVFHPETVRIEWRQQ
jgi:site-specific DNA recombinase